MTKEEYLLLYEKYLAGRCSPAEEQQLFEHRDDFRLSDLPWKETAMGNREATREAIYRRLKENLDHPAILRPDRTFRKLAAALIALLACSVVLYLWMNGRQEQRPGSTAVVRGLTNPENDLAPGKDRARLILSDGTEVILDEAANGMLGKEGGTLINKSNGQLVYVAGSYLNEEIAAKGLPDGKSPGETLSGGEAVGYNTVATPRGGQYRLVLPDGSQVWLNAASSLRFPTSFSGAERRVELDGEGYFEVARRTDQPFKVSLNGMEVEVLGTHFNIKAYGDEKDIQTTLLEGSVKIRTDADQVLLRPGQQALLEKSRDRITVGKADTEAAVAWKNGYFQFDNEDIASIMQKISRWYDVEIIYETNPANKNFTGSVSRYERVSEVLKMLELTGAVHFRIAEGRIIVMP